MSVSIEHVQEVLQLMSVMTGDHRYEEACIDGTEGGPKTMCDVLDRIESKGKAEGREEERLNSIKNLMQSMKWTAEQAMDALLIPISERAAYFSQLSRF